MRSAKDLAGAGATATSLPAITCRAASGPHTLLDQGGRKELGRGAARPQASAGGCPGLGCAPGARGRGSAVAVSLSWAHSVAIGRRACTANDAAWEALAAMRRELSALHLECAALMPFMHPCFRPLHCQACRKALPK